MHNLSVDPVKVCLRTLVNKWHQKDPRNTTKMRDEAVVKLKTVGSYEMHS